MKKLWIAALIITVLSAGCQKSQPLTGTNTQPTSKETILPVNSNNLTTPNGNPQPTSTLKLVTEKISITSAPVQNAANTNIPKQNNLRGNWAVFQYKDRWYIYEEVLRKITLISGASMLELSPDKTKLAYIERIDNSKKVKIYNHLSKKTDNINLDGYATQVMEISWHSEDRILISSHINPSTSGFFIYDTNSGNEINFCGGGELYQVLADNKSMLYSERVHFSSEPQKDNIQLDRNELYRVKSEKDRILRPLVSNDMKHLCFFEYVHKDRKIYLVLADLNAANGKLSKDKKIPIMDSPIMDARFDGDFEASGTNKLMSGVVSDDFASIAFWVQSSEGSYVGQASLDPNKKEIGKIHKLPAKYKGTGYLKFDDQNNLLLCENGINYSYKVMGSESIQVNPGEEQNEEGSEKKHEIFKEVLGKSLGVGKSDNALGIYDTLQWGR